MNDADNTTTTCANCGKGEESSGDLKACTACKLVKYCNRECQIAHRPLHKKACKKRADELHDEALFKEPPPPEDCPICFLPLPIETTEVTFEPCCGKLICNGCIVAIVNIRSEDRRKREISLCAFCRTPSATTDEEDIKRTKKLLKKDNARAFYSLAAAYDHGDRGMQQDSTKAIELWLRAGELGCAEAYHNLGNSYNFGMGVEVDKKKAKYYWELAAMNGDAYARHNLGCLDAQAGKLHRAMKHFILAGKAGDKESLEKVKQGFMTGLVTKDEYANTLRAYQQRHNEIKSDDRDKAKASYHQRRPAARIEH